MQKYPLQHMVTGRMYSVPPVPAEFPKLVGFCSIFCICCMNLAIISRNCRDPPDQLKQLCRWDGAKRWDYLYDHKVLGGAGCGIPAAIPQPNTVTPQSGGEWEYLTGRGGRGVNNGSEKHTAGTEWPRATMRGVTPSKDKLEPRPCADATSPLP